MTLSGEQLGFWVLAAGAIISAVGLIAVRNPVRSALMLIVNFVIIAVLYFTLNAQFLGIVQIAVYIGAILVLFLFVIMLLNLSNPNSLREPGRLKLPLAILLGGLFLALAAFQISAATMVRSPVMPPELGTAETIGAALFSEYVFPFEITSILLLAGIVGSILLAKRRL